MLALPLQLKYINHHKYYFLHLVYKPTLAFFPSTQSMWWMALYTHRLQNRPAITPVLMSILWISLKSTSLWIGIWEFIPEVSVKLIKLSHMLVAFSVLSLALSHSFSLVSTSIGFNSKLQKEPSTSIKIQRKSNNLILISSRT